MQPHPTTTVSRARIEELVRDRCARRPSSILVRCLYRVSRWAQRRSTVHTPADLKRTTQKANYRAWRGNELRQQLTQHFDVREIAGRDILDFGCGTGELCSLLATYGPRSVLGLDKSADAVRQAGLSIIDEEVSKGCLPQFACNEDQDRLPFDDQSIDLICCFDVVEHIANVQAVAREWRRVLRPRGRVWIWWSPWRGPYGHHLESLIPLPWIHLLLPERVIFETCAALYDDPDYIPRTWDLDPITHQKKANKWRRTQSYRPFLNRLTRRQCEKTVGHAGLIVLRQETHGFSGSQLRRATRLLLPFPILGDCFVSFYIYELVKR